MQLAEPFAGRRLDQDGGDSIVGEAISAGAAIGLWSNHPRRHRLAHGQPHGGLRPCACLDDQSHVEIAPDYCRGGQNRLRVGRETLHALGDERVDVRREAQLGHRHPFVTVPRVPERALLDQRADQVREEKGVAFGVAIEECEEFPPDFLLMERGRQPLLHFVASQPAQHDFRVERSALEHHAPLGRVSELALGTARQEDQDPLAGQSTDDVRQCVPRGVVCPLHFVENEDQRPAL
jgi:hypothetical protein